MAVIGFGIIGCGGISDVHARAIQSIPEAKLVGFYNRTRTRAERQAKRYGVSWDLDLDRFLKRPGIDAVSVCTPSGTHGDLGVLAAQAGKHVMVEKPIEVNLEKGRRLTAACLEAGIRLGVIYQSRFLPAVQRIRAAIQSGRLGKLLLGEAVVKWFRKPDYFRAGPWRATWALDGGGALINQSIHTIDLLQYLMGPADSVFGFAQKLLHPSIEAEDTAVAVVKFGSGALGVIQGATSLRPGFPRRLELHGDGGSVLLEGDEIGRWDVPGTIGEKKRRAAVRAQGSDPISASGKSEVVNHRRQFEDFIAAIREGRPPLVDGEEGLKALEIVLAVYRSAMEKKLVELPLD
jgi:predicted dehydrogenase